MHSFAILEAARALRRTDNGRGETIPLSTAERQADLCTAHITHQRKRTCTSTFQSLTVLILEAQILSGYVTKMTLYIINVIANLLLIMKKNQVLTSNI